MFEILIEEAADEFLSSLTKKSQKIIKEQLKKLKNNPFPGNSGDKELLDIHVNPPIYRMHIGRSYTAFYQIDNNRNIVKIDLITTIEQAHKLYGRFG